MKPYSDLRPSRIPWMNDVPAHWTEKRIKHLAQINPPKSEVRGLPADTAVTFLPMEAIGERGELDIGRTKAIEDVIDGYSYCGEGDVILAKITPCFENGKGAVAAGLVNGIGFATTEVIPLRCSVRCYNRFLYYLLFAVPFRAIAEGAMYGAGGQKRVADTFVANYPAEIPGPSEQAAIAAFLDRETAKIDNLIDKQEQLIKLLEDKRQAVISHAVTKGLNPAVRMKDSGVAWLGMVPEHWAIAPCYAHYDVQLGKMLDAKRISGEHLGPYLRNTDVQWGAINIENLPEMDFEPNEVARYGLEKGDLLVCEGGEVGRCAVWQGASEPYFYQKALHRVRPRRAAITSTPYFAKVLECAARQGVWADQATSSTIAHLTGEQLRRLRFPHPPIEEQRAIVAHIDSAVAGFDELLGRANTFMTLAAERRSALISAAVTGKIDVRNAV